MTLAADPIAPPTPGAPTTHVTPGPRFPSAATRPAIPVVFHRAVGADLFAEDGRRYLDFSSGAGSLAYGHNNPAVKRSVQQYLADGGITYGPDLSTAAEREFLGAFAEAVLSPRGLDYEVRFCGSGDAVDAARALAAEATGRRGVITFTGEDAPGRFDPVGLIERHLGQSGPDSWRPAAVIVEPVDLAGGVRVVPGERLRELRELTERHGMLLIADERRSGCGRTGRFFAFEHAGIVPDVVATAQSWGAGPPLPMTLVRRGLDVGESGGHHGDQLALVAATAVCELWRSPKFRTDLIVAERRLARFRAELAGTHPDVVARGLGAVLGLDFAAAGGPGRAARVHRRAFEDGLLVELCGRDDASIALLPPVNIDIVRLDRGLDVLRAALAAA